MTIVVDAKALEETAESRKMNFQDLADGMERSGSELLIQDVDQLKAISDKMIVKPEVLAHGYAGESDLTNGVRIYRANEGFKRTVQREQNDYYTYQHLATTNDAPELMALKVSLHCHKNRDVVLNSGHDSKELVCVLSGKVKMDWSDSGTDCSELLSPGDSVYLSPNIPHSFMCEDGEAEIIAVNYGRW